MILKRPLVTEKSMSLTKLGLYSFEVSRDASKEAIAKLVAGKFKVKVLSVKTINIKGKLKSQRSKRGYFTLPPIKKALVQIAKGQKIALFETASKGEEVKVTTAEDKPEVKEKKNILKGTKVKIEKEVKNKKLEVKKEKPKTAKQKSIAKKKGGK